MELSEFINKYLGKEVDFDGAYGAQCVDLFRQYCQEVLEVGHTGAVEGAKDLYLNYENMGKEKAVFEKIRSKTGGQYGDVAIYDATPNNPYGHVAIVLIPRYKDTLVFEQRGGTKDPKAQLYWRSNEKLLGFLRIWEA